MLKPKRKRIGFTAFALAVFTLAGCSQSSAPTPSTTDSAGSPESGKSVKISMLAPMFSVEPPKADSPEFKMIEDYTHAQLTVNFVPAASYQDKLNVTIASGKLPDIIVGTGMRTSSMVSALRSGAFWEVGPYLKDYPNLSKMDPVITNNNALDGKIYGVYRDRPEARAGFVIRKDWLDNLGLEMPKTLDELYTVLKAFTFDDPDKNGKDDTYGVAGFDDAGWNYFVVAFGGPNGWGERDGKLVPDFMTQEYKDTMKFFKKLADEKIMVQDFAVVKQAQRNDNINKNKAGFYAGMIDDALNHPEYLTKIVPDAKIDVFTDVAGPDGVRIISTANYINSLFLFPKQSVKTEARLKELLGFIDKMADEKMATLIEWGMEGVHYTLKDGTITQSDEQRKLFSVNSYDYWQLTATKQNAKKGEGTPLYTKVHQLMDENAKVTVKNPALWIVSDTYLKKGTDLDKIITDNRMKYLLGQIDDAGWEKAIEEWKKQGGDKVLAEYNDAYEKMKK